MKIEITSSNIDPLIDALEIAICSIAPAGKDSRFWSTSTREAYEQLHMLQTSLIAAKRVRRSRIGSTDSATCPADLASTYAQWEARG